MTARVLFVGMDKIKLAIRGLDNDLTVTKPEMRRLLGTIGRASRDYVRKRITTQGDGNWPKLSKWTRARTGRRKALVTERLRIVHRLKPRKAEVAYMERSSDWNLTMHHKGFTQPGLKDKTVTVPLRNPGALRWKKNAITFRNSKDSVVPARDVWGKLNDHREIAGTATVAWIRRILAKRAR